MSAPLPLNQQNLKDDYVTLEPSTGGWLRHVHPLMHYKVGMHSRNSADSAMLLFCTVAVEGKQFMALSELR